MLRHVHLVVEQLLRHSYLVRPILVISRLCPQKIFLQFLGYALRVLSKLVLRLLCINPCYQQAVPPEDISSIPWLCASCPQQIGSPPSLHQSLLSAGCAPRRYFFNSLVMRFVSSANWFSAFF